MAGDYIEEIAKQAAVNEQGQAYNQYTYGIGVESTPDNPITYTDPKKAEIMKGQTPESTQVQSTPTDPKAWAIDIAQSHHFTVLLEGMLNFNTPEKSFNKFLPVKTMQLTYTSYENMNIPLAIFGDFPLLNKKRVSTIQLTCYDKDNDELERQLRAWESACFPKGRYVAYLSNIVKALTYRSYNVKGQENKGSYKRMYVIPSGNLVVSRDYSANDAKMITFSLVCVGDGGTTQEGAGKVPTKEEAKQEAPKNGYQGMIGDKISPTDPSKYNSDSSITMKGMGTFESDGKGGVNIVPLQ